MYGMLVKSEYCGVSRGINTYNEMHSSVAMVVGSFRVIILILFTREYGREWLTQTRSTT